MANARQTSRSSAERTPAEKKSSAVGRPGLIHEAAVPGITHVQRALGNQGVIRGLQTALPAVLEQLHPAVGNHGVQRLLHAKLTVNTPGDSFEQEADRMAESVTRMPSSEAAQDLQPKCACGGTCSKCRTAASGDETEALQMKSTGQDLHAGITAPPSVDEALRSSGSPLDASTRAYMEPRFGYDFSPVRLHSGPAAELSAREVGAKAYTVGHNIVFAPGQFAPGTQAGQQLLAHELTHVVQQSTANTPAALQRDMDDIIADKIAHDMAANMLTQVAPYAYITQVIHDTSSGMEDNVGAAFVDLQASKLEQYAASPAGREMLEVLYQAIMTGDVTKFEREQGDRILDALKKGVPPKKFVSDVGAPMIFPARNMGFTRFTYAVIDAELVNGKVKVWYGDTHVGDEMFKKELATLGGYSKARRGFELDPDQIVGVKLYDQGEVTVYVPALALIDYSNQLNQHTLSLAKTAFISGLTVGVGGLGVGAGSRILTWADRIVTVYSVVSTLIDEHRDWILENFPNFGPHLLDAMDVANGIVAYYGYARLGLDGIRFVRARLGPAWKEWRKDAKDPAILKSSEFQQIDKNLEKTLDELANAEAEEAVAAVKEHPPKKVDGKAGERHIPVGEDHEIVEVIDKDVPTGIACEYRSPGHTRVKCPEGMGIPDEKPAPAAPKTEEKPQKAKPEKKKKPATEKKTVSRYSEASRMNLVELDRKFPQLEEAHVTIRKRGSGQGMREEKMFTNGRNESYEAKLRSGKGIQLDDITPEGVVVEIKMRTDTDVLRERKIAEYMEQHSRRELDFESNRHLESNVRADAERAADRYIDHILTDDLEKFEDQLVRQQQFIVENGLPGGQWITDSEAAAEAVRKIINNRGLGKIKVILVQ